ncbi:hypothetical protein Tco_0924072 [Tanacetum coccineum]|uniref:Integrase catalytic domain-containing protein n=1 Tax=Tanacetum coccineum TaxID=301880 RepID=A0ABQ5D3U8_9ASTR
MMPESFANSLKSLLRQIWLSLELSISDRGTHFCNGHLQRFMQEIWLVYGKALQSSDPSSELKALVALKQANFDLSTAVDHRKDCPDCEGSSVLKFCLFDHSSFKSSASFWESRYPNLID